MLCIGIYRFILQRAAFLCLYKKKDIFEVLYKKTIITLLITGCAALLAMPAFAGGTVNDYANEVSQDTSIVPNLIAFICYLGGFLLISLGVYGLKQSTEQGPNAPLKNPIAKLSFGGFFMALPPIVSAVQGTALLGGSGQGGAGIAANAGGGGTLGALVDQAVINTSILPDVASYLAYLCGFLFVAVALYKLKNHIEFGPQSVPLADPLKYLLAGGLSMALPFIATVAVNTFGNDGAAQDIGWDNAGYTGTPGTLDDMMIRFMGDIFGPVTNLFVFFCYVAGAVLMLIAIHRFTKTAQEGPRGPTGLGTVATFILAGVLFSIAPMVGVLTETLFGTRDSMTEVSFLALEDAGVDTEHARRVTVAVLAFLIIVGILSIIRGLFVLRGVAEGNGQMTMMGGISHLIAGAILVNFGQFANIIQNTLGVDAYGVLFN